MDQHRPPPPPRVSGDQCLAVEESPTKALARNNRSNRPVFVVAAILFCCAAALVFYAYSLWSEQRQTAVQLDSAKNEVVQLKREQSQVQAKVTQMQQEWTQREKVLGDEKKRAEELEMKLAATEASLEELRERDVEVKKIIKEFRTLLRQFKRMVDSGRLEVRFRRGRMIVELPEQVLFPSGSAELTDDGRQALRDVAKVLRRYRYKRFVVAGHTDNVPISNEQFGSNWELSASRAVNVTQALIRFGIKPTQLVSSGYAQFDPVASNATKAGRQKNRRIEIVLEPRLRDLEEHIEKQIAKTVKTSR